MHPSDSPIKIDIPSLQVHFSLPLTPHEIPAFRGAIAEAAGWDQDLFHNHDNAHVVPVERYMEAAEAGEAVLQKVIKGELKDRYHYRYPLIQYRVDKNKASIYAIGAGVPALQQWLMQKGPTLTMKGKQSPLLIQGMQEGMHSLQMLPEMKGYRLMDYLPFNDDNYQKWRQRDTLIEGLTIVEKSLTGHILGFAERMGYRLPERLEVRLMNISRTKPVRTYGSSRMAFNLLFKANIDLPPGMALGRGVSHGFGVVMPTRGKL